MKLDIEINDEDMDLDHPANRLIEHLKNTEISDEAVSAFGELCYTASETYIMDFSIRGKHDLLLVLALAKIASTFTPEDIKKLRM